MEIQNSNMEVDMKYIVMTGMKSITVKDERLLKHSTANTWSIYKKLIVKFQVLSIVFVKISQSVSPW